MYMFENPITLESKEVLKDYLGSFEYRTSDLSFTSLYMWREINRFSYQVIGDYLCIAGISHLDLDEEKVFMFPPLTKTGHYESKKLRETVLEAKKIFQAKDQKFSIRLLPSHMLKILEGAFPTGLIIKDDRPNHDYVYTKEDLAGLRGRKFHSKRNHLNHFKGHYSYEYKQIGTDKAEEAMAFIRKLNEGREMPDHEMELLMMEEQVIEDVMNNLDPVGYTAGAIYIGGEIQALTIGGPLGKRTMVVHVEKANTKYRGSYQAINNEFAKNVDPHIKCINREEDMDIPGLREAKTSYRPAEMVEKYIAKIEDSVQ